jgi:hypothetical protein
LSEEFILSGKEVNHIIMSLLKVARRLDKIELPVPLYFLYSSLQIEDERLIIHSSLPLLVRVPVEREMR